MWATRKKTSPYNPFSFSVLAISLSRVKIQKNFGIQFFFYTLWLQLVTTRARAAAGVVGGRLRARVGSSSFKGWPDLYEGLAPAPTPRAPTLPTAPYTLPLSLPRENLFVKQLKIIRFLDINKDEYFVDLMYSCKNKSSFVARYEGRAGDLKPSPVDTISLRHFSPPSPCNAPDDNFNMPGQFFVLILLALLYRIASPLLRILNIYYIEH